jgi:hypothetical protein
VKRKNGGIIDNSFIPGMAGWGIAPFKRHLPTRTSKFGEGKTSFAYALRNRLEDFRKIVEGWVVLFPPATTFLPVEVIPELG